tara:strand:+ start:109 stop:282 length:174 start_codon:yes stop_codon:yes gene_type:complete
VFVLGPYEVLWIGVAVAFLLLGPPLMGITLAMVRRARTKAKERKKRNEKRLKEQGKE